jgi:hypothetical protein
LARGWKELYFVGLDGNLRAATIQASSTSVAVEKVQVLFRSPFLSGVIHDIYDVDPKDGQRFIGAAAPDTSGLPLNIIANQLDRRARPKIVATGVPLRQLESTLLPLREHLVFAILTSRPRIAT